IGVARASGLVEHAGEFTRGLTAAVLVLSGHFRRIGVGIGGGKATGPATLIGRRGTRARLGVASAPATGARFLLAAGEPRTAITVGAAREEVAGHAIAARLGFASALRLRAFAVRGASGLGATLHLNLYASHAFGAIAVARAIDGLAARDRLGDAAAVARRAILALRTRSRIGTGRRRGFFAGETLRAIGVGLALPCVSVGGQQCGRRSHGNG